MSNIGQLFCFLFLKADWFFTSEVYKYSLQVLKSTLSVYWEI